MKLITNINGIYLREILDQMNFDKVDEVRVAVAYASGTPELFDTCWKKGVPLTFWGRYDHTVPITTNILRRFPQITRKLAS